ncbi:MAG: nuclear transport factor 2 family protein [Chloroflexi bacterium]|nr:nuclear transport factor 2 family protein [Chloroflexota bacterium]
MKPEQKKTLELFYTAATDHDATTLRSLLTDTFTFKSPIGVFDNPDDYVAHCMGFNGSISDSRSIAEGNQVVHMSILHAKFPDGDAHIPLCDVFTFDGDRITAQELFTDASQFPQPE